jgi:hypothetical protein
MNIKDLYKYIKPLIDIYYNKYFGEKKAFITEMIKILKIKAKEQSTKSSVDKNTCDIIYTIYYLTIFIIFLLLIIWILYDIYSKTYFIFNATFAKMLKNQIKLDDIPEFSQLKNIIYITDNFSFDYTLIIFISIIVIIIYFAYYFQVNLEIESVYKEFNILLPFLAISLIIGIIYYIYNFNYTNLLSRRSKNLLELVYNNINLNFINSQGICNYISKKNKFDDYFVAGKCNDIKYNFNQTKLYNYITEIMNSAYNKDNTLTLEKFKTLKDENGNSYVDNLSSAFFTFILIRYFVDNNLLEEGKDLFSTFNLIKTKLMPRINPILYLNNESILFNSKNELIYTNNPNMQKAFNRNKDIYNYVYNDYYNKKSLIQELIVDIYNLCKYKMLSVYDYYSLIGFIIICLIIYYFIINYYKSNKQ